jgi:hypothetical protein
MIMQSFRQQLRRLTWLVCFSLALPFTGLAQTSAPADTNATAANAAPASRAPDDVMKRLSDLVHAGKYTEAQQLTTGLLAAYPDDQRLIKAKALLDKALASSLSTEAAANSNQPATNAASVQPGASANANQPTGMDKVDYNALIELARQAQQNTDLEQQKALLKQFMDQSSPFLQKHPDQMLLWQLRAASAISLNDLVAGYDAGQKLLAMGASDSNDSNLQRLLVQLKNKGWLDGKKLEIKEQEMRFDWLLGTWNVNWDWYQFGINGRDQEAFVLSGSGVEGHVIGGDGVKSANPDFRGIVLDSGEIEWEYYLPPSNTGQMYVFRHISSSFLSYKMTVGRRSDPHGYFGNADIDTGDQQFYPSGWQPVSSYKLDKDKRTMTIVISSQEADPNNKFSKKNPVILTFKKADSTESEQVQ